MILKILVHFSWFVVEELEVQVSVRHWFKGMYFLVSLAGFYT
jgi:hypothetical protein